MQPFKYHVFVCDQKKPEGLPCCSAHGSEKVIEAMRREVASRHLANDVQITSSGSLGLCEHGPNIVVYPEGVWYSAVQPRDVREIVESHFVNGTPVQRLMRTNADDVKSEICQNRDRYLASLKSKDASGTLPDDLNQTIRGFQESRVILTAVELDLFNAVGNGATAAQAASKTGTNPRALEMLMNVLVSMGLLIKSGDVFTNTALSSRYFRDSSPDNARMALMHTVRLWKTWSTLTDCVRAGTSVLKREDREGEASPDMWTQAFIAAMHHNARERAPHLIRAVGLDGVRRMIDLGGGSGAYAIAFALANPSLRVDVLDLPNVLPLTSEYVNSAGLQERVTLKAGNLRSDGFGSGYDLALLSAICHMFDEEENRSLIGRAYDALETGGRLVIQDFILDADKTAPRSAALFSLNMLVATEAGASYSEPEYESWMRDAGFKEVTRVRLPGPSGLMVGRK
ncbi:MAG TPA: methyltransferase [Terriglobales bacterium]|nr:methyltransferase [Terriglobales bacterium]